MDIQILTELEYHILEQLKNRRYEYPLSREDLAGRLRWRGLIGRKDDRTMRSGIESLRKQGYLICHRKGKDEGIIWQSQKLNMRISGFANTNRGSSAWLPHFARWIKALRCSLVKQFN
jgi:hypothetical protein